MFDEISPIRDYGGKDLALYLDDYYLDEPKWDELKAKTDGLSYEAPLRVKLRLVNKKTNETFLETQKSLLVRIRHTGELLPCRVQIKSDHKLTVQLSEAVRGIAPGQYAVFYLHNGKSNQNSQYTCQGGGVICFD